MREERSSFVVKGSKTAPYPDGKSITYNTYNANKALTSMTDYLGNTTTYTYNSKGAVTAIAKKYSGTTSTKTTSYAYNTDGSLQKVTYPLSSYMTTTYTYDYAGRVSNLTNKLTSSTTYSTHAYTYDNSGNITQKVENIQGTSTTTSYIYDSFNRLLKETIGSSWNAYHYDQYGNLAYEYGWGDTNYTYDANNRLVEIEDLWTESDTTDGFPMMGDWTVTLNYDKNGNLLSSSKESTNGYTGNSKTYTYDTWGRMTNFSDTLGETASYTYYSDGLRASKTVGSNTTKYYYNGDDVINETLNGNSYATNVLGVNGYISRQQNGTIGYLFKNAHGDVISAYSSTTNKLADYTYNAWGEQRTENETTSFTNNPLRYAGQYYDYESGMTYLRARYYDSSIRRFITEDPIRDGLNWYVYCENNPVMFVDPSGESIVIGTAAFIIGCTIVSAAGNGIAQLAINYATGQSWHNDLANSVVSGAVSGAVFGATLNPQMAAISGTLVTAGGHIISGVKNGENAADIAIGAVGDIAWGAIAYKVDKLVGAFIKTNNGWFQPQRLKSFFIKSYGQKIIKQVIANGAITTATVSMYENNKLNVKGIQEFLNIDVDGSYGPKTTAAVKSFQQELINGGYLEYGGDDGLWGPKTDEAFRNYIRDNVVFISQN